MSIKAMMDLERMGFPRESFGVLHAFFRQHAHDSFKGGQHTNGGCHDGRCDFGSPECAAWTELMEVIKRWARPQ